MKPENNQPRVLSRTFGELHYQGCADHPDRLDLNCAKIRRSDGKPLTNAEVWEALQELPELPVSQPTTTVWECFCDASYYDLWCVRRSHERKFGQGFHMNSAEEAKTLTELLNQNKVA